jgi:hypothetical protein
MSICSETNLAATGKSNVSCKIVLITESKAVQTNNDTPRHIRSRWMLWFNDATICINIVK